MIKFGVAGGTDAFRKECKNSYQMPEYLNKFGLDAYEYSLSNFGRKSYFFSFS